MTSTSTEVYLYNVARGQPAAAKLWPAITERQLADWENGWMPELIKGLCRLTRQGVGIRHWPQSWHWNWRTKVNSLGKMLAYPGFSVVCDEMTQGMMIVDTVKHRGRIDAQKRHHIVYVEYIESAPWNRAELFDSPRYQGVGSILIAAAVSLSAELEFKGRVGLHSLPQADAFYTDTCGMTDLGPDLNYRGLRYFEMTPVQAQKFIAKGKSK